MAYYKSPTIEIEEGFLKKAFGLTLAAHALFIMMKFHVEPKKPDIRDNAIKVDLVNFKIPEQMKKHEQPVVKLPPKKPEAAKVAKQVQPKVDRGTLKKVVNSQKLGDPKAAKVQDVQKGDPASKNFTAYKPGTEFRKLQATNIGTGGNSVLKTVSAASGGSGDTYKGGDFALKSLTANKMGKRFSVSKIDDGGAGTGKGGGIGDGAGAGYGDGTITGTVGGTLEKAKILTNVGSLTGATTGIIGTSKGAEGLSTKGTIALAGTPEETVVMGSMDPNVIRQILMDHLAQFRYCYQSELERAENDKVNGLLNLNFDIGSTGSVKRVNVTGAQSINNNIKGCVAGVLRGINFPEPMGGGIVEVKQPMNFYSKYN